MHKMTNHINGVVPGADTIADQPSPLYPPRPGATFTVQQAVELTGLSEHTLRYYERAGLIDAVRRHDSSRHRRYSATDITTLETMACLRAVGMPLEQMRQYLALRQEGAGAASQHRALLEAHQQVLEERLQRTQRHLEYVQYKIAYWQAVEQHDEHAAASAKERSRRVLTEVPEPSLAHNENCKETSV